MRVLPSCSNPNLGSKHFKTNNVQRRVSANDDRETGYGLPKIACAARVREPIHTTWPGGGPDREGPEAPARDCLRTSNLQPGTDGQAKPQRVRRMAPSHI